MRKQSAQKEKTRIAFLASTLPTGGAEKVTLNLFSHIDRKRFECEFYFLKEFGTIGRQLVPQGSRSIEHLQHRRVDPMVLFRLWRCLRSFSPHIILTLNCHRNAMFWGGFSSVLARVPVRVIAVHHTGTMEGPRDFLAIDRIFLPFTAAIIALSETHRRYLQEIDSIDPKKIKVIENGIAAERFEYVDSELVRKTRATLPVSERDRLVIMVAAFRPEKAHEALISAAAVLTATRDDIKFLVVGDGPRKHQLEAMARELQLTGKILFLGERHDIAALLHLSDVLVLPSHAAVETLPLVVMEAMAAGVPVIASAVGSVPDMIQDRVNGILIGPGDSDGLANAIAGLFEDKNLSRRLIENGRNTVRNRYTLDKMVSKYEKLFDQLATDR